MLVEAGQARVTKYWGRPAKIIRSNRSGEAVGAFGETIFVGDLGRDLKPDFQRRGQSLWSYAADIERRRAVAVVLTPFGGGELQRLSEGREERIPCLEQSLRLHAPVPIIHREVLMIGHGSASTPARLYRGSKKSEKLVVWMHGGPDSSVAYEYGLEQLAELVVLGYDVLVPEYRGTRGNDLTLATDLGRSGRRAIYTDLAAIQGWVRSSSYKSSTLYGISFGGVYSWLSADSDVFDRHVLVAPLLKWRGETLFTQRPGEADWPGRRRFLATSVENVFGPTFRVGALSVGPELNSVHRSCRYRSPFLALFGELDDRSQVVDLGLCADYRSGDIRVLAGATHEATGVRAFDAVKAYLSN